MESCESGRPKLARAVEDDYPALTALYEEQLGIYPCSVARSADPWTWQVGDSKEHMLLTLTDRRGYVYTTVPRDQSKVWIHEGAAKDEDASRQLLAGLAQMALDKGLPEIQMGLPPDHPLVRMALLYGATQSYRPAIHGMDSRGSVGTPLQISIRKVDQDSPKAEQWFRREQLKKGIQRERDEILRKTPEIRVNNGF